MKTIEINKEHFLKNGEIQIEKIHSLMRDLKSFEFIWYPFDHFMIQPEVIIRVDDERVELVTDFLEIKNYLFKVYDYPIGEGTFTRQDCNTDVVYFDLFNRVYQCNSVAALDLTEEEWIRYIERFLTTAFNMRYFDREKQGRTLLLLSTLFLNTSEENKLVRGIFSEGKKEVESAMEVSTNRTLCANCRSADDVRPS